jgi:hypothetical protein
MTAGSSLWQTIFVSFALILIAFEVVRGWRLGIARQAVRLLALVCAYGAATFGGQLLVPILRSFLRVPNLFISIVAGAILALGVYAVINALGAILFKRTGQQSAGMVRLIYGFCGGLLGIFFGLFSVWLIVVAIRSLGAIANAEVRTQTAVRREAAPLTARRRPSPNNAPAIVNSLAKLENSIELGSLGEVVKVVDVVPSRTYQTLGEIGTMVANPHSVGRFLSYPGAKELTENPKIAAFRDDPEVIELIQHQRFLELLQHPKLIDVMNDPALAAQVRSFEFQKALDYALQR